MCEEVNTLEELYNAAINRKAIISKNKSGMFIKPRAAGFVINLQGTVLRRLFKEGLYIYKKEGLNNG
jgi:hypothetical protein